MKNQNQINFTARTVQMLKDELRQTGKITLTQEISINNFNYREGDKIEFSEGKYYYLDSYEHNSFEEIGEELVTSLFNVISYEDHRELAIRNMNLFSLLSAHERFNDIEKEYLNVLLNGGKVYAGSDTILDDDYPIRADDYVCFCNGLWFLNNDTYKNENSVVSEEIAFDIINNAVGVYYEEKELFKREVRILENEIKNNSEKKQILTKILEDGYVIIPADMTIRSGEITFFVREDDSVLFKEGHWFIGKNHASEPYEISRQEAMDIIDAIFQEKLASI